MPAPTPPNLPGNWHARDATVRSFAAFGRPVTPSFAIDVWQPTSSVSADSRSEWAGLPTPPTPATVGVLLALSVIETARNLHHNYPGPTKGPGMPRFHPPVLRPETRATTSAGRRASSSLIGGHGRARPRRTKQPQLPQVVHLLQEPTAIHLRRGRRNQAADWSPFLAPLEILGARTHSFRAWRICQAYSPAV